MQPKASACKSDIAAALKLATQSAQVLPYLHTLQDAPETVKIAVRLITLDSSPVLPVLPLLSESLASCQQLPHLARCSDCCCVH